MKKFFFLCFFIYSFCSFGWEETVFFGKYINQMCGFKLGELLKENQYVANKKVKLVRDAKNKTIYSCKKPPFQFMDANIYCVSVFNDGRISSIGAMWNDFSLIDIEKRTYKFNEIRKRLSIILNVPLQRLKPISIDFSHSTDFICKLINGDYLVFTLQTNDDGIILLLTTKHSVDSYKREQDAKDYKETMEKDAKAFGL
jgi:hypothetical protein